MQRAHECIRYLRVEAAPHILLQFLRFQHFVATRSLQEYVVHLAYQCRLFVLVWQSVDGEVRLQLALHVGVRLYLDGAHVYQLQYAS